MKEQYLYKKLSHIEIHEGREVSKDVLYKIKRGEKYTCCIRKPSPTVVKNDKSKNWLLRIFSAYAADCCYIAAEDRWSRDGEFVGTESEMAEYFDNQIYFEKGKPMYRPHVVVHFLDGCKTEMWFNNDTDMRGFLNTLSQYKDDEWSQLSIMDGKLLVLTNIPKVK